MVELVLAQPQHDERSTWSPPCRRCTEPGRVAHRPCGDSVEGGSDVEPAAATDSLMLARVIRELYAQPCTAEHTMGLITAAAVRLIGGAEGALIALVGRKGALSSHAPTNTDAASIGAAHTAPGDGPVRCCVRRNESVAVVDLDSDNRWPVCAAISGRANGIRSMVSVPLDTGTEVLGALVVYSNVVGTFSAEAVSVAAAFASHAALALRYSTHEEQFTRALAFRDSIGQAKGMIMERYGIGVSHAFAMLSKISQDTNTPITTLAERLTRRTTRGPGT